MTNSCCCTVEPTNGSPILLPQKDRLYARQTAYDNVYLGWLTYRFRHRYSRFPKLFLPRDVADRPVNSDHWLDGKLSALPCHLMLINVHSIKSSILTTSKTAPLPPTCHR